MPENAAPPPWASHVCSRVSLKPRLADGEFAAIGRALCALFEQGHGTLVLSRHGEEGEPGEFCLSFAGEQLRLLYAHEYLRNCLEEALTTTRSKVCWGCRRSLPLTRFSRDVNRSDGRLGRCRPCEAARVKEYSEKRRAKRANRDGLVVLPFATVAHTAPDTPQAASGSPAGLDAAAAK